MSMATRFGRTLTYVKGVLPIKLLNLWSHGCEISRFILKSSYFVPIATKPRRLVTYLDGLLLIKSHDP